MCREAELTPEGSEGLHFYEQDGSFVVELPLPGVEPENIDVTTHGDLLTIRAEGKSTAPQDGRSYIIWEDRPVRFTRSLRLPPIADSAAAQANVENGVLRLHFPRRERPQMQHLPVPAGVAAIVPIRDVTQRDRKIADNRTPAARALDELGTGASAAPPLSPREHEVLALLIAGLTNKQIAGRLIISVATVNYHVTSVLNKLGADNRTQAVSIATQHRLFS